MEIAKDFLNKDINVGDQVVFMQKDYRYFRKGIVNKITDKMVFIIPEDPKTIWDTLKQFHNQVIVIN